MKVSDAFCERSIVTGNLLVSMPKVNPDENLISIRAARRIAEKKRQEKDQSKFDQIQIVNGTGATMLQEAENSMKNNVVNKAVQINGLVDKRYGGVGVQKSVRIGLSEVSIKENNEDLFVEENDACPPPIIF